MAKKNKKELTPVQKFDQAMKNAGLVWAVRATGNESKEFIPLVDVIKFGFEVKLYIYNKDQLETETKE